MASETSSKGFGIRFTVKGKILFMNILIVIIMIVTSTYSIVSSRSIDHKYSSMLQEEDTVLSNSKTIQYDASQEVSLLRDYLLVDGQNDMTEIQQYNTDIKNLVASTSPLITDQKIKASFQTVLNEQSKFYAGTETVTLISDQALALQNAQQQNLFQIATTIDSELKSANQAIRTSLEQKSEAQTTASAHTSLFMILATVFAVIVALILGFYQSVQISRPLMRLVSLMQQVAIGDLRKRADVKSRDEIGLLGQAVNDMIGGLKRIMSGVKSAADSVSAASEEISAATEQVASGSTSQAESAETVNDLFKELSSAIHTVAKNAEEASALSSKTTDVTRQGQTVVNTAVTGMNKVSNQIAKLAEDSNRVGEIVSVIDDIAEQTNLLALNAAIEAARAGDQGRGFAVVADEVRKLAERSGEATKQITTIIKTMQANTQASVLAVNEGVSSTQQSGQAFEEISSMVTSSSDKVAEIAAASEQQAAQASEVMSAVESIAAAAQQAAASSEETASATQSLAQLAEELHGYVSQIKLD
ncbi:methyl-accepting chemotaxis protein [Alicyclobacillus ferrooxydans]|uniref:Chemotaxis protein n=1 Tax=Alicyclobacillus ferrooxydans TaxID=471514 RepID=A0A0P9D4E4_9BACL|nr:methyl-accepting chemotaxis protein [Alicyclobacillus ferrooxydans]KPV44345.1 hypothetical protein AN477_06820 [Alicyclobacillus ferrooxydans]